MSNLPRRDFLKELALLPAVLRPRDKFGACPDVRFKGTGFFRLEKENRWWLVTPEGNAFLSFGLNHVSSGLLRRPECIGHWVKTFGVRDASDVRQFAAGYAHKVREDLAALGMNTLGVHSSLRDIPSQQERAARFLEFGENAFARSDFVGWTWCGWIDGLKAQQQEKQHSGVQDPWGNYYRPLTQAMAGFSNRLYDLARG